MRNKKILTGLPNKEKITMFENILIGFSGNLNIYSQARQMGSDTSYISNITELCEAAVGDAQQILFLV